MASHNTLRIRCKRPQELLVYQLPVGCLQIFRKSDHKQNIRHVRFKPAQIQVGFRSGLSTMNHIQTVRKVIDEVNEYRKPLRLPVIENEKAFDSIKTVEVLSAIQQQNVGKTYSRNV